MRILIKIIVSALIITGISEAAKRFSTLGAILASLPLTSILAIVWLYLDTKNIDKISQLSYSVFWIVIPSLAFFIALPLFLKSGMNFWLALIISCAITAVFYFIFIFVLKCLGIQL